MLIGLGIWGFSLPPVRITDDGLVVGGRNRLCASVRLAKAAIAIQADDLYQLLAEQAKQAQVEAKELYAVYAEESKQASGTRNDLLVQGNDNFSQKIDQGLKTHEPSDPNERKTANRVAKLHGTNRTYVAKAKKVQEHAPELAKKVKNKELDLNEAVKEASRGKKS